MSIGFAADVLLRLSPRFSHVIELDGGLVLLQEDDSTVLTGRSVGELVSLLDGSLSAPAIADRLTPTFPRDVVFRALGRLGERGIVEAVDPAVADRTHHSGGTSNGLADEVRRAWQAQDERSFVRVRLSADLTSTPVDMVVTGDYLTPALAVENRDALTEGRPYLLARVGWESVWLGPYVDPGRAACWKCLEERLRLNLAARTLLYTKAEGPSRVRTIRPRVRGAAFDVLAGLVVDSTGGFDGASVLQDTLLVRTLSECDVRHRVHRLPQCAHCGEGDGAPPGADLVIRARRKLNGSLSGFRVADAACTLAHYQHMVDPLTGVVRSIDKVPVPGFDLVHVYTTSHAVSAGPPTLRTVASDHRDHSGGKGATDLDAGVSALCEGLERVSALHRGNERHRVARLDELGEDAVAPNEILNFSQRQFARRAETNVGEGRSFQWVPEPYDPSHPIEWTQVTSLFDGTRRWVPSAAVYLGFRGAGAEHCRGDSNGLAGGNCLEEAILQGFLELVERDAVAIWWYNRLIRPGVELGSFDDAWLDSVASHYAAVGRELWALDLTSDLGVPCFGAFSAMAAGPTDDIIFGFAAHLDAGIALRRAVTEVNQMLPTVLKTREDRQAQLLPDFADALTWWDGARRSGHPYLLPAEDRRPRRLDDFERHRTTDLRDDIDRCVRIASDARLDLLACELTRPDVELPVVRVIVPGMRHFWRRLGPGRLYDVPVALALRDRPIDETEMNPVSMFV